MNTKSIFMSISLAVLIMGTGIGGDASALNYETEILLKLLEKKGVITSAEAEALRNDVASMAAEKQPKAEAKEPQTSPDEAGADQGSPVMDEILESVQFSGAVEVEAGYESIDPREGEDEESSDISLATAEFGVDAVVADRVKGHILFYYEDDEDVVVDEAYIAVNADAAYEPNPDVNAWWYASAGKLYAPFGAFESHFISDPLTLELGETRETAALAGVWNNWVNAAAGVFNGDINEVGEDDHIAKFFAAGFFALPEESDLPFGFRAGVSYISDISDSNGLTDYLAEEYTTEEVQSYVQGFSAFISANVTDMFTVEAEYLGALDEYKENPDFEPQSWNFELAFMPIESLELALRYGGSDKTMNFLPDSQYGGCITYSLFENTSLALEYLQGEYENDDETQAFTAQLAVEF